LIFDASSLYILLKRGEPRTLNESTTLDLAFYEVGNSLVKELRRKLVTFESFANMLKALGGVSELMVVRNFRDLDADRVSTLSMSTGLTFYDASYLTLALVSNEGLATNDLSMKREAQKLGLRVTSV
jgi:predicted nucleic acid-binding protein